MEFVKIGGGAAQTSTRAQGAGVRFEKVADPEAVNRFDAAPSSGAPRGQIEPVYSSPENDAGVGASFVAGFASDDEEKVRLAASKLFPHVPLSESTKRFGLQGGQVVYRGDDGKLYHAYPASGARGVGGALAYGVGPMLPLTAGTATGIATTPLMMTGAPGLAASMSLTGSAGAVGETARQAIGDLMLGEASTGDLNAGTIVTEGVTNALGQGIGKGMEIIGNRRAVQDIAKYDPQRSARNFNEARFAGVDLTPAEGTGLQSLGGQQKHLSKIVPTADTMAEFYEKRDSQVVDSFRRFLDGVSPAADAEDVGLLAKKAAQGVIDDMKGETLAAAKPLYEAAYEAGDRELFSPELERLTGSRAVQDAMQTAVKNWQDDAIADGFGSLNPGALVEGGQIKFKKGGPPVFPNLQFWDYTKRALDRQASAIADKMPDRARTLSKLAKKLRGEVDNLVPGVYANARKTYGTGAEDTKSAMESALGVIANSKDRNVMSAARHLFNPATRSPQMVSRLRVAIEHKDPMAWKALKRLYMQDVFSAAMKATEKGEVANPAGKLVKAFSDPKMRANLYTAMNRDERQAFDLLQRVYKNAAKFVDTNSDTAFKQLAALEAQKGARPWYAKVARNINPSQAIRSFDEWATDKNLSRQASAAAEIITAGSGDTMLPALKELRKLSPKDVRFRVLFGHVLAKTGRYGVGSLLSGSNKEVGYIANQNTSQERGDRGNERIPARQ